MTNEFKRLCEGIFGFLLLSVQWTPTFCVEDSDQIVNHKNIVPRAKLGDFCPDRICDENQFCNHYHICQCLPGFKSYNYECVPSAGENEFCKRHEDCSGHLMCINGICRKPGSNNEFVKLAKICLGITVTTIIIAIFSSLVKCLVRKDNSRAFRRQSDASDYNSRYPRHMVNHTPNLGPDMYDLQNEKPPSYEECVRGTFTAEPPPYIISSSVSGTVTSTMETNPAIQSPYLQAVTDQNLTTPLNVQNLSSDKNSNAVESQSSGTSDPDTTNKASL